MKETNPSQLIVRAGDCDGLGTIYSSWGGLICQPGESILKTAEGWDVNVRSPWRRLLPKLIFTGFGGDVSSKLYITTTRIVLIRKVDIWRELKEELTPLGIPKAAEKEAKLRNLQVAGARQYCAIRPQDLRVAKSKKFSKPRSILYLYLTGTDGRDYAITIWKPKGMDDETLSLIESRFAR
jgi:hypothetical protein